MSSDERRKPALDPEILERLRQQYRKATLAVIDGLRVLATELAMEPASPAALAALGGRLHQLRGSAGSYGLTEASRLAADSERRVAAWIADPALEADERSAAILSLAEALEAAVSK
jgi:chemotaxis protein histidine kinase CheA